MTSATAIRPQARTDAPALPTGPAFDFFITRHPEVDQARIARRWQDAVELYHTGHVGQPNEHGTRIVTAQNCDDPNRPQDAPSSYTVNVAIYAPRAYACSCPDWTYRGGSQGFCKHTLAVWIAVY